MSVFVIHRHYGWNGKTKDLVRRAAGAAALQAAIVTLRRMSKGSIAFLRFRQGFSDDRRRRKQYGRISNKGFTLQRPQNGLDANPRDKG